MNFRRTHDQFTKSMFPEIPMKLITNVNDRVDNPTYADMFMNRTIKQNNKRSGMVKNPYDIFALTTQGHRTYNHDLLSGMFMGVAQAQKQGLPISFGMNAAIAHQMEDYFSNKLVSSMGVTGRNVMEALMMSLMAERLR